MTNVNKGIPLIMVGGVGIQPRRHLFFLSILKSRSKIVIRTITSAELLFTLQTVKCGKSEFHIVHPIVFCVDIRGRYGSCLCYPQLLSGKGISALGFLP